MSDNDNASGKTPPKQPERKKGPLEFVLSAVTDIRAGEATTALVLTLNVFVLLTAYYLLKVAREPLVLLHGGADVKQYASAGQSIVLVVVTWIYSELASRADRMKLIAIVNLFFTSNLVLFAILTRAHVNIGVPFYIWVGIFNRMVIAQFWAFGADIYTEEAGKRLFPILGIGSSAGAVAGSWIANHLLFLGPSGLMFTASALLIVCLGLSYYVHKRESAAADTKSQKDGAESGKKLAQSPIGDANGFALLFKDKYLILIACVLFVLNWVNTTGEYVLDKTLLQVAAGEAASQHVELDVFVGHFKANYFEWYNALGMFMQLFLVSRVIKYVGVKWALFVMPAVSLIGYGALLIRPALSIIFAQKVAENSLDYSLENTTNQSLWLVTTREAKYKTKQIVDTFIVRAGDVMTGGVVWIGSRLHLPLKFFLSVNVGLVIVWIMLTIALSREFARREKTADPKTAEKLHAA